MFLAPVMQCCIGKKKQHIRRERVQGAKVCLRVDTYDEETPLTRMACHYRAANRNDGAKVQCEIVLQRLSCEQSFGRLTSFGEPVRPVCPII